VAKLYGDKIIMENIHSNNIDLLAEKAYQHLIDSNYKDAIDSYEKLIELEPTNKSFYWYLGLLYLLEGQETEAQTTWYLGLSNQLEQEIEEETKQLIKVLTTEVNRRKDLGELSIAWVLCQHIKEINPQDINNLLQIIDIAIERDEFVVDNLYDLGINNLLQKTPSEKINTDLLINFIQKAIKLIKIDKNFLEFFELSLPHIHRNISQFINIVVLFAYQAAYNPLLGTKVAIYVCEIALKIIPDATEIARTLGYFYCSVGEFELAFQASQKSYLLAKSLPEKIYDNYLTIRSLLYAGGYNEKVLKLLDLQTSLITSLSKEKLVTGDIVNSTRLYNTTFYFSHTKDQPRENMQLRRRVAEFCQKNIEHFYSKNINQYRQKLQINYSKGCHTNRPLKIGYLSYCLKRHSVGWLARSLFSHYDREKFEVYAYFLAGNNSDDPLTIWYEQQVTKSYRSNLENVEQDVSARINQDEIDILIDLDSVTLGTTSTIMAMKPAPVQATWLGWDASSIVNIDYYIADHYVLPEDAQDYYQEKIWRLPQTYLAVDGFAIAVPTLKRVHLGIPDNAVIYFTSQMGHKYHPDNIRLQMKILYEVPNSYFIIKCFGKSEKLQKLLLTMAESEGVSQERIKFIGEVVLSETHRANLGIADIVLDTYPYNGATTTMETLWMGIPIITKVGQQFAARNSYTMMINAGITEGIAWTDEEYVEWGIRLGKDENLRRDIAWKLKQGRQTAPLWNAKQFTREMENAYQQMWQNYVETK
jgi:predicted O-linked N-acetylglucosamine transferase (SPINDLY family)